MTTTVEKKTPKFYPEIFEEALGVLQTNIDQKKYNLSHINVLELAYAAGGALLANAMSKTGFTECTPDFKCENCWLVKYCIHRNTPIELRKELSDYIDITMASFDNLDPKFVDYVIQVDKTDPQSLKELNAELKKLLDDPTFVKDGNKSIEELILSLSKTLQKVPGETVDPIKDQ